MERGVERFIYLDHNATTPVDPRVLKAMIPFFEEEFGNPSSAYPLGVRAREAVERARTQVASLLRCRPAEVIFTSGGTESNNMVLKGVVEWRDPQACHIITSSVEHPSVLQGGNAPSPLGRGSSP